MTTTERSEHSVSREAAARDEFARTAVRPGVAWATSAAFALLLVLVPAWGALAPGESRLAAADVYDMFEGGGATRRPGTLAGRVEGTWEAASGGVFERTLAANAALREELETAGDTFAERSPIVERFAQPLWRWFVLGAGASTERVHPGADGVLFYRPAVDALTGPGFLAERALEPRGAGADPRAAIAAFHALVSSYGAELLLVPVPGKAAIHSDALAPGVSPAAAPVRNPSWERFMEDVRAIGVHVVDLAPSMVEAGAGGELQYLRTDTHWTPAAMERAARRVAQDVLALGVLEERPAPGFTVRELSVEGQGDLARILGVPPDDPRYGIEEIAVRAVLDAGGLPWQPDTASDVILLGDSFTNIYSDERMGFGRAAGFGEHLALALDRGIDRVARNDAGAFATRLELARERARGRDRLTGKRVVVWQFAARELAVGRWIVDP